MVIWTRNQCIQCGAVIRHRCYTGDKNGNAKSWALERNYSSLCSSLQDKLSAVCHLIKKQLKDICHEKKTVAKWEKVKDEVFSKVLTKDIFGQISKDLKVSQRANMNSTGITIFIYTHMQILYFCFIFNTLNVYKMYITNAVNIFRANGDEMQTVM